MAINEFGIEPIGKVNDRVIILGFAPSSRDKAPLDEGGWDIWPINELYMEMPQLEARATAWFQLHGLEPPTARDPNHKAWLAKQKFPVFMWWQHPEIPNSVRYPLEQVLHMATDGYTNSGANYFTNTISWLIALAVAYGYKRIALYGVDMAQDNPVGQEYAKQRPSCEFWIGVAKGRGIQVDIPPESDLLQTPFLYGPTHLEPWLAKLEARNDELNKHLEQARNQRIQFQNQAQQILMMEHQYIGAIQDNEYMLRLGAPRRLKPGDAVQGQAQDNTADKSSEVRAGGDNPSAAAGADTGEKREGDAESGLDRGNSGSSASAKPARRRGKSSSSN